MSTTENSIANGSGSASASTGVLSPPTSVSNPTSPRSSLEHAANAGLNPQERIEQLEHDLQVARQEKDAMGNQYRNLLGKLTAMRQSLGDKLREDAEELDRRETTIHALTTEIANLQAQLTALQSEMVSGTQESTNLQSQLAQLRSQSDSSSSDVLSLTREMRELRGEMERLRVEREEWEGEAGRERERREEVEEEMRGIERREREGRREWERGKEELDDERERARNLQDVLGEFQAAKDSELRQATMELETQLRMAATSLSEYKLRAANAETRLSEVTNDASRSSSLEKELREKSQLIGKLRHDAVVNNEHLTEALRRLRKNSSDNNVDRRLVTNILLSFLTTPRADQKRFEMLSLMSTILAWDDHERERAGLQRVGGVISGGGSRTPKGRPEKQRRESGNLKTAEEEAVINESFGNLFVEFLLKESSQGQARQHPPSSSNSNPDSPGSHIYSPPLHPHTGASTPYSNAPLPRPRGMSTSSNASTTFGTGTRKPSYGGLQQALGKHNNEGG